MKAYIYFNFSCRQVLAKLRFVLELIEAIVSVAENKSNPIAQVMIGGSSTKRKSVSCGDIITFMITWKQTQSSTEAYRRAEQLVLYVRALHIISSALVMAQRQSIYHRFMISYF
jgi:serine/threonine-protein kinase ULK/ATG1